METGIENLYKKKRRKIRNEEHVKIKKQKMRIMTEDAAWVRRKLLTPV